MKAPGWPSPPSPAGLEFYRSPHNKSWTRLQKPAYLVPIFKNPIGDLKK